MGLNLKIHGLSQSNVGPFPQAQDLGCGSGDLNLDPDPTGANLDLSSSNAIAFSSDMESVSSRDEANDFSQATFECDGKGMVCSQGALPSTSSIWVDLAMTD